MRLSLRRKLVGGFGLLLALIVLLGWVTLSLFASVRSVQREVFDDAVPGLVAVDEIVRAYTAQTAAVRGYLIESHPSLLQQYRSEVEIAAIWEDRAMELFTDSEERELLAELVDAGDSFNQLVSDKVVPLADEGRRALAFSALGQGAPLIADIETFGNLLRTEQERLVVGSEIDVQNRSNQAVVILLLVLVGALVIGILLALWLPRRLSDNLSKLVRAARGVGRGDFDQEIDIRSGDELEELGTRFREMQSGLKRLQQLALQDHELEIAASIQQNLLQRTLPQTPGVLVHSHQRQANLVGGDWYDVDFTSGALTIVAGDASGKGIGAALMATVALSVLRAERRLGANPKRIVERTNEALREATDPDSFTTVIYATMDAASGEMHWFNMGHPAPFLLRGQPATAECSQGYYLEGPRNRALGWFEDPGLVETVVRLEPGDRVIFYTDGFLEAKSPNGEVFGDHRFSEAMTRLAPLDAETLAEDLVREVEGFAAGKLDDDLTMLIVEFQPAAVAVEPAPAGLTGEETTWHSKK